MLRTLVEDVWRETRGLAGYACLAAMLAGQTLNENPALPVYGCVVIGKMWQFMVLEGKNYCQSRSFAPDDEEIFDIYRILQGLKTILLRRFEN